MVVEGGAFGSTAGRERYCQPRLMLNRTLHLIWLTSTQVDLYVLERAFTAAHATTGAALFEQASPRCMPLPPLLLFCRDLPPLLSLAAHIQPFFVPLVCPHSLTTGAYRLPARLQALERNAQPLCGCAHARAQAHHGWLGLWSSRAHCWRPDAVPPPSRNSETNPPQL